MTHEEFQRIVSSDPHLAGPIQAAAKAGRAQQFSLVTDVAVVALIFPIARFVLTRIGLPWLSELGRYSELQRQRVHDWIDTRYRDEGFDPEQAEAVSDKLIEQLESTTDLGARAAWERLVQRFPSESDKGVTDPGEEA